MVEIIHGDGHRGVHIKVHIPRLDQGVIILEGNPQPFKGAGRLVHMLVVDFLGDEPFLIQVAYFGGEGVPEQGGVPPAFPFDRVVLALVFRCLGQPHVHQLHLPVFDHGTVGQSYVRPFPVQTFMDDPHVQAGCQGRRGRDDVHIGVGFGKLHGVFQVPLLDLGVRELV